MLEARNLTVMYGAIQALDAVSLTVAPGSLTALLGANGAGKSTVIRAIAGWVPLQRGELRWRGQPLPPAPEARARLGIGVVPEGRQLWAGMTVAEHLLLAGYDRLTPLQRLGTKPPPELRALVEEMLERFPVLRRNYRRLAETMSGGEQQMLALARAFMTGSDLVILDEPSVGLAPKIVGELFDELHRAVQRGLTVLLVEQNAEAALEVADWGYVLQYGRIVAEGSGSDLRGSEAVTTAYLGVGGR